MKWALKFSTKGKGAGGGGGPDGGKSYQGSNSLGNNGGAAAAGENGTEGVAVGQGGFRSGSEGEVGVGEGGGYYGDDGVEPGQEGDTATLTPPEAANGGGGGSRGAGGSGGPADHQQRQERGAEKYERELREEESSATYEGEEEAEGLDHNNSSSAPHFTVDSAGRRQGGGGAEGEEMDYEDGERRGPHEEQGVYDEDEDGDSQADSFRASKTARMKALEDDPEAHLLGETDAEEWDVANAGRSGNSGGDRYSGNDAEGSHSDHTEAEANGVEEGYGSNPSRGRPSTEDRPHDEEEEEEEEEEDEGGLADQDDQDQEEGEEEEEQEDEEGDMDDPEDQETNKDEDDGRRHHGVGNGGRSGGGGGGAYANHGYPTHGDRTSRDQTDLERRAMAHAYADGLDGVAMPRGGEAPGGYPRDAAPYGDRHQRNMPPAPPGVANGISPVDARAATALAARTRLAAGGVAVPDRGGVQRPEPAPVLAPGQAALAAEAALRRGPTPGSHSLPSMVLVPLEALKAHRRVPRSSDRRALVRYRDLPDRSRSFVVFVSHAWMRPHTTPSFAHPDTSSRGGEKYRLIAEAGDRIRAHLPPDVRVLLWIDYSCVDQDSTRRSKATMRGMREYMRRCDAILTVYPGDAADNGEEFLPNRFVKSCAWAGSYKSLAHYCTRGWCRLEMLLGQTEPLPQDGFMFNFLVPKKKKASGAKASVGDRPHFLYGAHQRPHNGRIDVVPRQSSRWFEEHHPEQGNFTHESDRDAIRAVLAKQTSTMAKRSAAIAARYGTDPRRGGGGGGGRSGGGGDRQLADDGGEYGRPH